MRFRLMLALATLLALTALLLFLPGADAVPDTPYHLAAPPPGYAPPAELATAPPEIAPRNWSGEAQLLVLLIQFPDYPAEASHDAAYYRDLLFADEDGSMRDYFQENSYDDFTVNGTVLEGWFNASHNMSYYGRYEFVNNESEGNAQTLVREAIALAAPQLNFSHYDRDGDGGLDHLVVVHSGPTDESNGGGGPAGDDAVWSHRWGVEPEYRNGTRISGYTMQGEGTPMGVFAHEFGHDLGLPDLYDTDYSSSGIGKWGLMSGGSWLDGGRTPAHFCAWSKIYLGWLTPIVPTGATVNISLPQVENNSVAYKLPIGGADSREYFLLVNRQQEGYDAYLPGHGLLVWHVDDDASQPNDNHRLVDLEEADANNNPQQASDPWANSTTGFTNASDPSSHAYDGSDTRLMVVNISHSEAVMNFTLHLPVDLAVVHVGPAWAEIYRTLNLTATVENRGFVATNGTLFIDGVVARNVTVPMLAPGELFMWREAWLPQAYADYALNATLASDDERPGNDRLARNFSVTTPALHEDFETGLDWETGNASLWHATTLRAGSGDRALYAGQTNGEYVDGMNDSVVLPWLDLSRYATAWLVFDHWYRIEADYDGGVVEWSGDGVNWSWLVPEGGYPGYAAALDGDAFTGGSGGWTTARFNLSGLPAPLRLRLRFASDFGATYDGWFIDEVLVHGRLARGVALAQPAPAAALPGTTLNLTLALTNTGGEDDTYRVNVTTPAGWEAAWNTTIALAGGASGTLALRLTLPAQAVAEPHAVEVTVVSENASAANSSATVAVDVLPVYGVALAPPAPDHGLPGAVVVLPIRVTNLGNTPATFTLTPSTDGWNATAPANVTIAPYGNATVDVTVTVPEALAGSWANTTLRAASAAANATTELALGVDQRHEPALAAEPLAPFAPGERREFAVLASNHGNGPAAMLLNFTVPANWSLDRESIAMPVGAWSNVTLYLNLTAPASDLDDGDEALRLSLDSGSVTAEMTLAPTVAQSRALQIDAPDTVGGLPEADAIAALTITNRGDGEVRLALALAGGGWAAGLDNATLTLAPGAAAVVNLTVAIPADTSAGEMRTFTITVGDAFSSANATVNVTAEQRFGARIEMLADAEAVDGLPGLLPYRVVSTSNGPQNLTLVIDHTSGSDWGWSTPLELTLAAGASRSQAVEFTPPRDTTGDTVAQVTLTLKCGDGLTTYDTRTANVTIAPRESYTLLAETPESVTAGRTATVVLQAFNDGNVPVRLTLVPQLPEGWHAQNVTVELGPGRNLTRPLYVTLPGNAASGAVPLAVQALDAQGRPVANATVWLSVANPPEPDEREWRTYAAITLGGMGLVGAIWGRRVRGRI